MSDASSDTSSAVSTAGWQLRSRSPWVTATVELLSSMRFSISLLTLICIASVIGTILKQNEPAGNYVNQFGPFWAEVFTAASLTTVYSAWWFMLILAFLVASTSLCVIRNTPKIWVDLKTYKENIRAQSLKAFGMHATAHLSLPPEAQATTLGQSLAGAGWKVKLQRRDHASGDAWMVAAKAGAANKLGYIAAHSAIVLVCIGGLLDGDLMLRAQMLINGKTPFFGGGMMADVPAQHRLSANNPTFRGNILVNEGDKANVAILNQASGIVLQELPFAIELKKFVVEHYSTGMPKLFASDIVIHDLATGAKIPQRVEVNHPASYRGIEIYQSSFDDGGSAIKLQSVPMAPGAKSMVLDGVIGGSTELERQGTTGPEKLTLEYTGLRVINVENLSNNGSSAVDVRKVDLRESIETRLGAANKTATKKELRNVGPSVSYKLRDAAGQAKEFNNYMLPVDTGDGQPVYLLGARETPSEPFRYLRVPVDSADEAGGGIQSFARLRAALADPAMRAQAVKRYAALVGDQRKPDVAEQLQASTARALELFAGNGADKGGLQAVSDFLEARVPEGERARAGEVLVRLLHGVVFELMQLDREANKAKPIASDDKAQALTAQMLLALSDAVFYPAPMAFMLTDFTQVQASVFQVARAPGKYVVYLGCTFLIIGIFAMLYIRERRLWIWVEPGAEGTGSHATMALSTNRKTMDTEREFDLLNAKLLGNTAIESPSPHNPSRSPS